MRGSPVPERGRLNPGLLAVARALLAAGFCATVIAACTNGTDDPIEGRPGGPYRLTLSLTPREPQPNEETWLEFELRYAATGKPVADLQLAHERLVHNFIVDLDFSSFAHIHHEDFAPVSDDDRRAGRLRFPYRFPHAGHYRIVSEFAHRDRNWLKHFDIVVGEPAAPSRPAGEASRFSEVGEFSAELKLQPQPPVAGFETDLTLVVERAGVPVTDLALYLGTELHGALWREDGRDFGHLHSYTPRVAAIMDLAHDRGIAPAERGPRIAEMMVQLMCLEAELVFEGPEIPMRYVFPEAGRYHIFLQIAPGGEPVVFPFVIDVSAPDGTVAAQ